MGEVVKYNDDEYDGWGTFDCSVCGKSTFLQYDSYEKPSNGQGINYKGKFYVLCDKCCRKCMEKGMKKYLKDAHDYKETPREPKEKGDGIQIHPDSELSSLKGLLALIPLAYIIAMRMNEQRKGDKDEDADTDNGKPTV